MLGHLRSLAGEIAKKSHRLSFTLRPTALDDQGLMGALQSYAEAWSRWAALPTDVVLKHAVGHGAARVSVLVQRRGGEVATIIEDDGPGFDAEALFNRLPGARRLGIFGMQERARLAGGTLTVESAPEQGTTVFLRLPLPSRP